jgi:hypothetical protein
MCIRGGFISGRNGGMSATVGNSIAAGGVKNAVTIVASGMTTAATTKIEVTIMTVVTTTIAVDGGRRRLASRRAAALAYFVSTPLVSS